jgi:hypothetical protein
LHLFGQSGLNGTVIFLHRVEKAVEGLGAPSAQGAILQMASNFGPLGLGQLAIAPLPQFGFIQVTVEFSRFNHATPPRTFSF